MNTTTSPPLRVALVESQGCHSCVEALEALTALAAQGHPLQITTIDAHSDKGRALMQRHRAAMTPLVLVEDEFFSQGRLPRAELVRLLQTRSADCAHHPTSARR